MTHEDRIDKRNETRETIGVGVEQDRNDLTEISLFREWDNGITEQQCHGNGRTIASLGSPPCPSVRLSVCLLYDPLKHGPSSSYYWWIVARWHLISIIYTACTLLKYNVLFCQRQILTFIEIEDVCLSATVCMLLLFDNTSYLINVCTFIKFLY